MIHVYCWATGRAEVGEVVPPGAIELFSGERYEATVEAMNSFSLPSKEKPYWHIPGFGDNADENIKVLIDWTLRHRESWINKGFKVGRE